MTNLALLLGLALTDSIFAGYRAAAGRNARLHKVDYYLRGMWLGIAIGTLGALIMLGIGGGLVRLATEQDVILREGLGISTHWRGELDAAAGELVRIYGVFATLLLGTMLLWTYPKRRLRELSVVLILGPFTLIRPYWIAAGAIYVAWHSEQWLGLLSVLAATTQLGAEWVLNRVQRRSQARRLRNLMQDA